MKKKDALSKIFAILGTILVWFPILAPVVLGFVSLGMDGVYRFDYLMPAELGLLVFAGGALLLWGAIRTKLRGKFIAWGFGLATGSIAILMAIGDVIPGSWQWAIAIGLLITYILAIVVMGIGGLLLWKDLSEKPESHNDRDKSE
jgi:hypothetical protein